MKIKFFNPESLDKNLKATIHRSGKLGFTIEAAKKMNLSQERSVSIGVNEDDKDDKNLYILVNQAKRRDAFPILKAGAYYYINTKTLFDSLKLDYVKSNISYEITEGIVDGVEIFILRAKEKERVVK